MFDIGFSELLLIGVVALLVIGPERLPKVARTVGAWLGRLNRYVSEVKGDIDRELRLEELRKMQQEMKDSAQKYEILADETGREIKREVEGVESALQGAVATERMPGPEAVQQGQVAEQEAAPAIPQRSDAPAMVAEPVASEATLPSAPISVASKD